MKSPMITNAYYIKNKSEYTDLMVCQSAAGYYVGTMANDYDDKGKLIFQEPGSRDSDYFRTYAEAEALLKTLENSDDEVAAMVLRSHP